MRFQFGDFIADDEARLLLHKGSAVHLSPKAFDLLLALLRERPRALRKEDLHSRIWPDTFVSDASLAMLVAEARAALGESARTPRYVRTLHRHGYAFQGPANELASASQAEAGYWLVTGATQIPLLPGDNIVGRDPKARVWLDAPSVSRQHARIRINDDRVTLEDLGSKNGTRARDQRVTSLTDITNGDELLFGSVRASFRTWSADPTRTDVEPS